MRRSKAALHLSMSPLVYVLAQVRFSAIVKMDTYIPDIQEQLRHEGFPRFSQGQVAEITLDPNREPQFKRTNRWDFQSRDGRLGIALTPSFIIIHTSNYETYENFELTISLGLRALMDCAGPSLVERIGLRYIDLIQPRDGENFSDYLKPSLHGLKAETFGARAPLHRYEFQGQTDAGRIVVRWSENADALFLPPDLVPSTLQHEVHVQRGKVVGLLDLDHFTADTRDFDPATVLDILQSLHDNLDLAFRSAVTENGLNTWGNAAE